MSDVVPKFAVIYGRVSTYKQKISGVGQDMQDRMCRTLCELRGLKLVCEPIFEASVSRMEEIEKRPGLQQVIETVAKYPKGEVVVVVYKLNRLSGRQRLLLDLLDPSGKYALPLISATESFDVTTSIGRAMLGMLAVFAQLGWEEIRERNLDMQAAAKARGSVFGGPKMHEVIDKNTGERLADPARTALVRKVQALYRSGDFTMRSLAEHLNDEGVESPRGKRWHTNSVAIALRIKL